MRARILTALIFTLVAGTAMAVPTLQLDILGGTYDTSTETIIASADTFTLVAILTPKNNASPSQISALLADTYYISSALTPEPASAGAFGSFTFEGATIDVTDDMVYGTPPLEANLFQDPGDLQSHGIFPTFFTENGFQFSAADTTTTYNSQDFPGGLSPGGSGSYYATFEVDVSALDPGHAIHFDLYNTQVKNGGDIDRDMFAPFSHDAESGPGGGNGGGGIPKPGTVFLMGAGLALLASRRHSIQPA